VPVKPIVSSILMCDSVITEAGTNKKSLIGVFNRIWASTLPAMHPNLWIFMEVTGIRGEVPLTIKIKPAFGSEAPIIEIEGRVRGQDHRAMAEISFHVPELPLMEFGDHLIEVLSGGHPCNSRRFAVTERKEQS